MNDDEPVPSEPPAPPNSPWWSGVGFAYEQVIVVLEPFPREVQIRILRAAAILLGIEK